MLLFFILFSSLFRCSLTLPVFPGAEGFGSETPGGRGGKVIVVENTNGDGPGSLHEALTTKGPRIIVFRVGGTITFKETMEIKEPFVTVLGQTAPGKGIALAVAGSEKGPVMTITTHDVALRHLRVRPGPSDDPSCCRDGLAIFNGVNIVLDHISVSWSTDENIGSWYGATNVTWSNSMTYEALDRSNHEEGGKLVAHSMGALWGYASQFSLHHVLFARNNARNPQISHIGGTIDHRYNYVHQATNTFQLVTQVENVNYCAPVNIVGNLVRLSSSSRNGVLLSRKLDNKFCLYVKGNIGQDRPTPDLPEENYVGSSSQSADRIASEFISKPHDAPPVTRNPFGGSPDPMNEDVRQYLLKHAGCTKPMRDDDDLRLIDHVANDRSGSRINSPPNGIVQLPAGTPRPDADKDGIPDNVESSFGLSSSQADSDKIDPSTGYAYIELWANGKDLLGDEYIAPTTQSVVPSPPTSPATTTTTATTATGKAPTPTANAPTPVTTTATPKPTPSLPPVDFEFKWGSTPSSGFPELTCTTEGGAKMTFQASYDNEGVHLDASVTGDSTPFNEEDDGGALFNDDALEMIFDVAKTGTTSLTPGAFKVIVSRAGKVYLAERHTKHDNPASLISAGGGKTSTSSGWSTKALIKWAAFQSSMGAASLSAPPAPNTEIRFHVRLIDTQSAGNQQFCDSKPLSAVNKINNPEQYGTARFVSSMTVQPTSSPSSGSPTSTPSSPTVTPPSSPSSPSATTSTPSPASPTGTTVSIDLYETFTAAPDDVCDKSPGSVGCTCNPLESRPCASSALICVDLGTDARCARLRTQTPVVSFASTYIATAFTACTISMFAVMLN